MQNYFHQAGVIFLACKRTEPD